MSNGQTNGIPQGSILMDFIAEIVLGYADLKLARKLKSCKECKTDYKIIRYRDDYRIFTNNSQQSSIIAKNLSKVLSDLNFKVNSQKTIDSNDLILGALKPDKIHWIYNKRKTENIQKWVLQMYELGRKFPNSGTLFREIDRFLKWLENTNTNTNTKVLISILVNLVYNNPRCFSVVMLSICFLITKIKKEEREDIIIIIKKKFKELPNTDYLDIWLQRLTLKICPYKYNSKLCKKVSDSSVIVWNSEWLNEKFKKIVDEAAIINSKKIKKMKIKPSKSEVLNLGDYYLKK